ncbi:polysialyltransferase family glycosyltransferase [Modicisalibacter radicis]|uniref:polysialyltransferase family glycosyltransferase n=1 Tax=Halomonas sp. EAR18 TaxID=2518972 RepID=UPI0014442CED|nr:polysialyltransferase family glycosyltransferase [Halomonas sp. EAR18]
MEKKVSVLFIATKPLQIMMAMVIRDGFKTPVECHLHVVLDFLNADDISKRIKSHDDGWKSVTDFPTRQAAIAGSTGKGYSKIFLDSDVGVRNYISLNEIKRSQPDVTLSVYEEGCGTYQDNYYPALKAALLRLLGIGERLGGCRLTDELWIYEKYEYLSVFPRSKVLIEEIDQSLLCFIKENTDVLNKIFLAENLNVAENISSENCIVYLSSWEVDRRAIASLQEKLEDCYVKLHPHIREFDASFAQGFTRLVPASIPAEMLIMELAKLYMHIVIYHHDSSVERYMDLNNVEYINLG